MCDESHMFKIDEDMDADNKGSVRRDQEEQTLEAHGYGFSGCKCTSVRISTSIVK